MGRAAALNPRSTQGKRRVDVLDEEAYARALMAQKMREIPNRYAFERWLLGFPKAHRDDVRRQMQPYCLFTIEARRTRRIERDAYRALMKDKALRHAGVLTD